MGATEDLCRHSWLNFQTKIKFFIASVRLILPKLALMYLPGHDGEVTSDQKIICNSYQRYKGRNREYCTHFSMIFETSIKFLIVFERLILGKVGIDEFTGPQC